VEAFSQFFLGYYNEEKKYRDSFVMSVRRNLSSVSGFWFDSVTSIPWSYMDMHFYLVRSTSLHLVGWATSKDFPVFPFLICVPSSFALLPTSRRFMFISSHIPTLLYLFTHNSIPAFASRYIHVRFTNLSCQACINEGGATVTNSNARIIRIVKILRILRIAKILKLVKFVT
jgi:hypothetical protein